MRSAYSLDDDCLNAPLVKKLKLFARATSPCSFDSKPMLGHKSSGTKGVAGVYKSEFES